MTKNDDEVLKRKYREYAMTDEAAAVYFVRDVVNDINTRGKWIDVIFTDRYAVEFDEKPAFKKVIVELFDRKIKPQYPKNAHQELIRAITWETSHRDIDEQKLKGIVGPQFEISGLFLNNDKKNFKNQIFENWLYKFNQFYKYDSKRMSKAVMIHRWEYKIAGIKELKNKM